MKRQKTTEVTIDIRIRVGDDTARIIHHHMVLPVSDEIERALALSEWEMRMAVSTMYHRCMGLQFFSKEAREGNVEEE